MNGSVRWGIAGTARIARTLFLPSLREAGNQPAAVAGRDRDRTQAWAAENGIGRTITGYAALVDDPDIDALYIPLPNSLHGEWTVRALRAGKAVLCEKPLTGSVEETEQVLAVARETGTPLWEALAFPFHDQMARLRGLLGDGVIGDLVEITSNFHFLMSSPLGNIRMSAQLAGGALLDVGCYPVRLARDLFGAEPESAWARADYDAGGVDVATGAGPGHSGSGADAATRAGADHGGGVDVATWGWLTFPGGRHLYLSCGFGREGDTFTRLMGTGGQINVTNPFHPGPGDTFEVRAAGREPASHPGTGPDRHSFTPIIKHIEAVLAGAEAPRLQAVDTSLGSARALRDLAAAARLPGG